MKSKVGGVRFRDALLTVLGDYELPLSCYAAGDMITVSGPSFGPVGRVSAVHDITRLAASPAQEQQLVNEIAAHLASVPALRQPKAGSTPLRTSLGSLFVAASPMYNYEVVKYLNLRHRRRAMFDVAMRTSLLCAATLGMTALAMIWRAAMVRRRAQRAGLCPSCGYDLRASIDRCPECGTAILQSATPSLCAESASSSC